MVKRLCVVYPDGSVSIQSPQDGEAAAINRARRECVGYNKGERDDRKHAAFGEIQIDLMSFKELRWELSRMWAPDGHRRNLLTKAVAACTSDFQCAQSRISSGECNAIISYADPNVGHAGTIYRAASWIYLGQSEEGRYYTSQAGEVVSRRSFHSSERHLLKREILSQGYVETTKPGKHRFAKGLTRWARNKIKIHAARPLDERAPTRESAVQPRGAAPSSSIEETI